MIVDAARSPPSAIKPATGAAARSTTVAAMPVIPNISNDMNTM